MGRQAIGIWLAIALLGIVLYMLPALLKQLFFMKEQYVTQIESAKDDWKYERIVDTFVDVPAQASQAAHAVTPDYLQIPHDFEVGGAGASLESQPAPVDMVIGGPTPMELQGQQMKKAPAATGTVEGFQAGPSAAPVAPSVAPTMAPAPSCDLKMTYNPNGSPVYTCDGKIVDSTSKITGGLPTWLKATTTKDGIDAEEATIMNYWLANKNETMPGWVQDLAKAETITDSEKKALATWTKDNVKPSQQVVVPTKTTGAVTSNTSTSTSTNTNTSTSTKTNTSTGKACKPKCPPKETKCVKDSQEREKEREREEEKQKEKEEKAKCGPIDMGDYIRKDSIPCWACKL